MEIRRLRETKRLLQDTGIEKDATHQQIKEVTASLLLEFHPDRNKGDLSAVEKDERTE